MRLPAKARQAHARACFLEAPGRAGAWAACQSSGAGVRKCEIPSAESRTTSAAGWDDCCEFSDLGPPLSLGFGRSGFGFGLDPAFTLIELLVVIAVIAILASMLLPVLSGAKARAERIQCANNLKQISVGLRLWADDHGGKFPWLVDQCEGGGKPNGTDNAKVNLQFCIASNELTSIKLLLCPSDFDHALASSFGACYSTNISYDLGVDGDQLKPAMILSTDRSLSGFDYTGLHDNTTCYTINTPSGGHSAKWDKAICHHAASGNTAFSDGSVQQLGDSALLKTVLNIRSADTQDGTLRFFVP